MHKAMTRSSGILASIPVLLLGVAACDGEPDSLMPRDPVPTTEATIPANDTVKLYWTAADENNQPTIKVKEISKLEASAILDARRRAREALAKGIPLDAIRQSAATLTSTNWANDCQYYEWFLVTSQSNGGGDIFCTKSDGFHGGAAYMPFLPAYYDKSINHNVALCNSDTNCFYWECGGWGSAVWNLYFYGTGTGNISPPSDVRWIDPTPQSPC